MIKYITSKKIQKMFITENLHHNSYAEKDIINIKKSSYTCSGESFFAARLKNRQKKNPIF